MEGERKYSFEIKDFDKYMKVLDNNHSQGELIRKVEQVLKEKGVPKPYSLASLRKEGIALLNLGWYSSIFKWYFEKEGMGHVYEPYKPSPKVKTPKKKEVTKNAPVKGNTVSPVKGNKTTVKEKVYNKPTSRILSRILKDAGLEDIETWKFELEDSDSVIYRKVRYVKDLIKGRKNNVKLAILEYYDIHVDLEKRYNQMYYYGWKNLNEKKYKFYVGNKNKM
jgi:hypothetical protein